MRDEDRSILLRRLAQEIKDRPNVVRRVLEEYQLTATNYRITCLRATGKTYGDSWNTRMGLLDTPDGVLAVYFDEDSKGKSDIALWQSVKDCWNVVTVSVQGQWAGLDRTISRKQGWKSWTHGSLDTAYVWDDEIDAGLRPVLIHARLLAVENPDAQHIMQSPEEWTAWLRARKVKQEWYSECARSVRDYQIAAERRDPVYARLMDSTRNARDPHYSKGVDSTWLRPRKP
jgi:hypothetical protein